MGAPSGAVMGAPSGGRGVLGCGGAVTLGDPSAVCPRCRDRVHPVVGARCEVVP